MGRGDEVVTLQHLKAGWGMVRDSGWNSPKTGFI
jgi:hypothetical protein